MAGKSAAFVLNPCRIRSLMQSNLAGQPTTDDARLLEPQAVQHQALCKGVGSHEYFDEVEAGLFRTTENSARTHIFPYDVEKYARCEYGAEPWFKAMQHVMFGTLEARFGWHMPITAEPI
jgi:hypothetical protein